MVFPSTDLDVIVEVYLGADPTADPATWPAPTDLSSRLLRKPIQIRRGRGQNQKTAQAGACTLWLDNSDGALTPLLATSTYYPDWDLGVPLRVSVDNVGASPPYVRHAGFVASIEAVMVPGAGGTNISAVRVTSAGPLRRIGQGAVTGSPLRRTYLSKAQPVPTAYWPCEDQEGSLVVASGLPAGTPLTGAVPHFTSGIAGSDGAVDFVGVDSITTFFGATVLLPSASGFQIELAARSDAGVTLLIFRVTSGNALIGLILADVLADDLPHHICWQFVQNGADVDFTLYYDGAVSSTGTTAATTLGTSVRIESAPAIFSSGLPVMSDTFMVSHVAVYDFASMTVPSPRAPGADGYADEMAHDRISRVCAEEGIPYSGTATTSIECGPQSIADTVAILQETEAVDHGMLTEDFAFGLGYRSYDQRVNLAAALTIDLSTYRTRAGTQADVLTPVRNDARIRNEWTISRPSGSFAVAVDEAHQAKRGRFKDSATVNVAADTRLPDEAQWRVHEGTFEGLRYDTIPLDIGANE